MISSSSLYIYYYMNKQIVLKLISRFSHDIISAISSIHLCLQAEQYDLALNAAEKSMSNIMKKRDIISSYDLSEVNGIYIRCDGTLNNDIILAVLLIKSEYMQSKIEITDDKIITYNRYLDMTNVFVEIAKMLITKYDYDIIHTTKTFLS